MWVKICANTNAGDVQAAAAAGADAVGFVFAPSRRRVTPAQAGAIAEGLPAEIERVGVFGAVSAEELAAAVVVAGLDTVQLHGGVAGGALGLARSLDGMRAARTGRVVEPIFTVHWPLDGTADEAAADVSRQLAAVGAEYAGARVLVDAKVGTASGGLGRSFDWEQAAGVLERAGGLRAIVAGGLSPANVGEAVAWLRPWGVDVASGVEREPGRKDHVLVREFVRAARAARSS